MLEFVAGADRASLESDRKLTFALVRCLEIVGEAGSQLSADARVELPGVPWAAVIGMRNRLIHAYFSVDLDILWNTVTRDPPMLLEAIAPGLTDS